MQRSLDRTPVEKLGTHIPGFDLISNGGLPKGRTTLISGTAGSAKTVFAVQFLVGGIVDANEPGVFVTFEETPEDIRKNMRGFRWDIGRWEDEGKWVFVDASPVPGEGPIVAGSYDLGALLVRTENAVKKIGARRVAIDSLTRPRRLQSRPRCPGSAWRQSHLHDCVDRVRAAQ